ncbi:MAG: binary toxin-like calcium binding domain-containing protein, partial [Promethearchaeota archaeon]
MQRYIRFIFLINIIALVLIFGTCVYISPDYFLESDTADLTNSPSESPFRSKSPSPEGAFYIIGEDVNLFGRVAIGNYGFANRSVEIYLNDQLMAQTLTNGTDETGTGHGSEYAIAGYYDTSFTIPASAAIAGPNNNVTEYCLGNGGSLSPYVINETFITIYQKAHLVHVLSETIDSTTVRTLFVAGFTNGSVASNVPVNASLATITPEITITSPNTPLGNGYYQTDASGLVEFILVSSDPTFDQIRTLNAVANYSGYSNYIIGENYDFVSESTNNATSQTTLNFLNLLDVDAPSPMKILTPINDSLVLGTVTIEVQANDTRSGVAECWLTVGSAATRLNPISQVGINYTFEWIAQTAQESFTTIVAHARDNNNLENQTSITVRVDVNDPVVTIVDPAPDLLVGIQQNYTEMTINITIDDTALIESGISLVEVRIRSGSWAPANVVIANTTYDYYWNISTADEGLTPIEVRATDNAGNQGTASVNVIVDNDPEPDEDNDGLPDSLEDIYGTNKSLPDSDFDGLNDGDEVFIYLTDPLNNDTDSDGLLDGEEVNTYGTNATLPDTDGDTLPDGWEVAYLLDPLNGTDAGDDPDTDGLNNLEEYNQGTDPRNSDSDGDGVNDGDEVNTYSSDPNNPDSDGDGLEDGEEVTYGTNLNNPDSDGDGLSDYDEVILYGTNPQSTDTDGDGLPDGWEIGFLLYGLNATDPSDAGEDPDGDGLTNLEEYQFGSYPNATDSDGDGLLDGDELSNNTNPLNPDTDGDGLPDLWEVDNQLDPTDPTDAGADTDSDGLTNEQEFSLGTDPNNPD